MIAQIFTVVCTKIGVLNKELLTIRIYPYCLSSTCFKNDKSLSYCLDVLKLQIILLNVLDKDYKIEII